MVVCISCTTGASGEEVGKLVAKRLGFTYADEEVVARAAARGGIDAGSVADEESRKSRAARVLEALALTGDLGLAGVPPAGTDEVRGPEIRALIRETIEHMAAQGNVVIVAHAASHACPPDPMSCVSSSPRPRMSEPRGSASQKASTEAARTEP